MAKVWLAALGDRFVPADDDAQKVLHRFEHGECAQFSLVRIRDLKAHRRYWKLMEQCALNCVQIQVQEFPPAYMDVKTKEDVHTAIKMITGHYDTVFDADGAPVFRVAKTTNFEEMTRDEWDAYWPRVIDAVCEWVFPGIDSAELQFELMKLMGISGGNK